MFELNQNVRIAILYSADLASSHVFAHMMQSQACDMCCIDGPGTI